MSNNILSDYRELIRGFAGCVVALVLNAFVVTMAEIRARTKTNTSAVAEDDALKQRFGLAPAPGTDVRRQPDIPLILLMHAILSYRHRWYQRTKSYLKQFSVPTRTNSSIILLLDCFLLIFCNSAHNNLTENFLPFFMAAVSYIVAFQAQMSNPDPGIFIHTIVCHLMLNVILSLIVNYKSGVAMFAIFVVARWGHTICYLAGWQPFRTIFFLLGTRVVTCIILPQIHH